MIDFQDLAHALHQWRSQQGLISATPVAAPAVAAAAVRPAAMPAAAPLAAQQFAPPRRPGPQTMPPPPPMEYHSMDEVEELHDDAGDYAMSFGSDSALQASPPREAFGAPVRTMHGHVPPSAPHAINRDEAFGDDGATVVGGPRGRDELE